MSVLSGAVSPQEKHLTSLNSFLTGKMTLIIPAVQLQRVTVVRIKSINIKTYSAYCKPHKYFSCTGMSEKNTLLLFVSCFFDSSFSQV